MTAKEDLSRRVWPTAFLAVGLLAALTFGASLIGLATQIPIIARLCREAPPSSRHRTPTG